MSRPIVRLAKVLAWAVAGALGLVLLTALFLATSFGESYVRRTVERMASASTGATVTLDALELQPWRLEGRLDGVTARRQDAADDLVYTLEVATVRARIGPGGRWRFELEAPELTVRVRRAEEERAAGPTLGERLDNARIGRLAATGGVLRVLDPTGAEVVRLDGVALELDRSGLHRFAAKAQATARVRAAEERVLDAGTLRAEGEIAGAEIRLAQARLERPGGDLTARGTLRESPRVDGAIEADFRLATEVVRELFPELHATGEIEGTATLALGPEGLRVEADFRGAELAWDGLGPFAAGGRLRLADRRLDLLEGSLAAYGGRADLTAGWDLDQDAQSVAIEWAGVDLGLLAADLDRRSLPAELQSSGEAEIATEGFARDAASGAATIRVEGRLRDSGTPIAARAEGRLEHGAVEVEQGSVDVGAGHLDATGRVSAEGELAGSYQLRWSDLGRIGDATALLGVPAPPLALGGALTASGAIAGTPGDPSFTASVAPQRVEIAGEALTIAAEATADRRALALRRLVAQAGGGHLRLEGVIGWSGASALALRVEVDDVDLCALFERDRLPACGVLQASGRVSGSLDEPSWTLAGEVSDLRSRPIDTPPLVGGPRPADFPPPADSPLAVPGLLRFRAHQEGTVVVLDELRGILDGGAIDGAGRYDAAARQLAGRLRLQDLPLASLLPQRDRFAQVAGTFDLDASIEGRVEAPRGVARLAVRDLAFQGRPLPEVEATLTANGGGDLEVVAHAGLDDPFLTARIELERPFPVQADLHLGAIPADAVVNLLGELPHRLEDPVLAGRVAIDGALGEPDTLHVRGEIGSLEARYGTLRIAAEPFALAGDRRGLRIESLRLRSDGSTLVLAATLPMSDDRELDVRAEGDLDLELLATPDLLLDGVARLDVTVGGRWRSPRVAGAVRFEGASGRFRDLDWHGVSLSARLAERQIFLDSATGRILGGVFSARGGVTIEDPIEQSDVELVVDLRQVDLARLAPGLPGGQRPYFLLDAEATLQATRLDPATVEGWIDLDAIRAGAEGNEMASLEATRILIADGRATLPELHLQGGGTDLRMEGETSIERPFDDVEARVIGAVDFAQLGFLAASLPGLQIGGIGNLDLEIHTGPDGIELTGGGAIAGGRVASTRPRFLISDIVGELAFRGSAIRLRRLQGRLGGGTVEARASIDLENLSALESVVLEAEAREVNLTFGEGVRARFTGDALFQGRRDQYRLRGDLRILSGLFTRELDSASSEREFLAGVRAELAEDETAPFAETVELAVRLATEGDVHVDNSLTRVPAGGSLRVEGTLAQPELTGLITNTETGILRLGRNVFNLELARIELEGYPIEPPYVEVVATTEVAGHTVRIELEGPPDDIDTQLTSTDPSLTQGDLASLLTTGRTSEAAPEGAAALLEVRAAAYLGELFKEQLGLGLVFDTPATLPILSSETGPESRFTVGRRLTDEVTIAYSVGAEDADEQLWILDYQPLRRLWFRVIEESGEAFTFEIAQRFTVGGDGRAARPEPVRILTVAVVPAEGVAPLPPLTRKLGVKPGQRYDYWRAEDAADRLRRELAELGYLGAQAEVDAETGDRGVTLRFVVDPGPVVSFRWAGDDPGEKLKRRIEGEWGGQLPPGLLVADLAARATNELRADGWYLARAFGSVADEESAVRVVEMEVRLGPRGKGVDVEFAGNSALDGDALRAALPRPDAPRFFAWIAQEPQRIEDLVALRYAEEGFLDVRIGAIETAFNAESQRLRVQIPVHEGLRYTVESIVFPGAVSLTDDKLGAQIPIDLGEPFALSAYRESGRQLRELYRQQGFPEATARSRVRRIEPGALEVSFAIEEGQPAVVGHIEIAGHQRTREETIRRRLRFETGEPLRTGALAAAERELYKLGVFRSVEVVAQEPRPGSRARDVLVRLIEKPALSFDYGLRYRTDDVETLQPTVDEVKTEGLEAVMRTQLLQPFRRADSALLSLFFGEERRRARLGYQVPLFFGRTLPTEFAVESGRETRERFDIEVKSRSSQLAVQQRRSFGERTRLLYGFQLLRGRVDSVAGGGLEIDTSRRDWVNHNHLTASVVHDARDDIMNPRRGLLLSGTVQAGSPEIGASTEFARVNGQFSLFVPLGRGRRAPVWASSYRSGAIWSNDPFGDPLLDLEDRFTAGGPFSVRGFESNTLGPTFPDEDGFPIGGRGVVIFNQELRFPIWADLWGGVFYDVGNVFALAEDIALRDLRDSYGVGLRYDIGFGVLRVDLARLIDPLPGESQDRLHISFGHAF